MHTTDENQGSHDYSGLRYSSDVTNMERSLIKGVIKSGKQTATSYG